VSWWLLFVGLALLVPFPWLETPWRFVVPGVGVLVLLLGAKLAPPPASAPPTLVRIDEWGVERWSGGPVASLPWAELVAVELHTTAAGPRREDAYWLLVGASGGVTVPGEDPAAGELLARLGRLRGFDHRALLAAMDATGPARFRCWSGAPGAALVCAAPVPTEAFAPSRAGRPSPPRR
ncbi:MAG: hypothetical protein ACK4YP_01520, partial [Myxococcota bacterium]